MEFTKPEVNVQIWNIPKDCKTKKLGWKLAVVAEKVLECNLYDRDWDMMKEHVKWQKKKKMRANKNPKVLELG
ncbi:hypothetical protein AHAS_Ahas05G0253500 [Arachis hypogaea]